LLDGQDSHSIPRDLKRNKKGTSVFTIIKESLEESQLLFHHRGIIVDLVRYALGSYRVHECMRNESELLRVVSRLESRVAATPLAFIKSCLQVGEDTVHKCLFFAPSPRKGAAIIVVAGLNFAKRFNGLSTVKILPGERSTLRQGEDHFSPQWQRRRNLRFP